MPVAYEELKAQLEKERTRLLSELEEVQTLAPEVVGYGNHMADSASGAFDQARDLALRQNLERMLHEVEKALNRFEEGTYGLCEECGQPIDPARLTALPWATLCLDCQHRREQ
ncbi:MAG: conjugal transfer protein TraR [Chloroflexi bacterium]|nr:MAG: conjugal transfer protein TraR [Chloroflexota bacterium]